MTCPRVCTGCNRVLWGKLQASLRSEKVQLIVHSPRPLEEQEGLVPGSNKRGFREGRKEPEKQQNDLTAHHAICSY